MITLTQDAEKELTAYFAANPDVQKSVRLYLAPGGCCGPAVAMALDEANDQDETEEVAGIMFCTSKTFYANVGAFTVDANYTGFHITTEKPLPNTGGQGGCASCGGGCGGCH